MTEDAAPVPDGKHKNFLRWFYIYAIVWVPIACAYTAVFLVTVQLSLSRLVSSVASNVFVPFLLGLIVYWAILAWVIHLRFRLQAIAHLIGSLVFSYLWAQGLFLALSVINALASGNWRFSGFSGAALIWQYFQGVTVYFMIAAGTYAVWFYDQLLETRLQLSATSQERVQNREQNILSRFFARSGEDILPFEFSEVISITGADDYVEIVTGRSRHLSRLRLHELEAKLDSEKFIRVHRSHIVNVDKIGSLEPAGNGRITIHLENGSSITASRNGAQKLRDRLI